MLERLRRRYGKRVDFISIAENDDAAKVEHFVHQLDVGGYRAVDNAGNTVDFLLTAHSDRDAARRFSREIYAAKRRGFAGQHRQERLEQGRHRGL